MTQWKERRLEAKEACGEYHLHVKHNSPHADLIITFKNQ